MKCEKIRVENFRNIEEAWVEFSPGVNLLYGDNAQGKTNLLEALSLLALGRSFRGARDAEMIRFGQERATVEVTYADCVRENTIRAEMQAGRRRLLRQNGLAVTKRSEIVGGLRVVLFCPEHLSLIKGSPELRRSFLDLALSQLRPLYMASLQRYLGILKERNRLIKLAGEGDAGAALFRDTVDIWSCQLAHEAATISYYRARYVEKVNRTVGEILSDMTGGREVASVTYIGSSGEQPEAYFDRERTEKKYRELLNTSHAREIGAGFTLWGPHRDDIGIELGGACARLFASQGQQRSLSLCMKLAEGEICREDCGEYPVFLFDDVMSELDSHRRAYMTEHIRGKQVIMTGCELSENSTARDTRVIYVKNGRFSDNPPD